LLLASYLGKLTDCLESPQPHVTNYTEDDRNSRRDAIDLCSDDYTNDNSEQSGTDDLQSRTRLFEAVPPWSLDDLFFGMVVGNVAARVGRYLHWMRLGHVLELLGAHCNGTLSLSLKNEQQQRVATKLEKWRTRKKKQEPVMSLLDKLQEHL
jgi:hypothetical protein